MTATLKETLQETLAAHGLAPLHRYGQNFMIDGGALADLAAASGAGSDDAVVVEVGPGTGHLTDVLLDRGARIIAVEIDHGLHALLTARCAGRPITVHCGDALDGKHGLHPAIRAAAAGPWRLAANLPYDAALPIILNAVAMPAPPRAIAVTIQAEAAERLCARPGTAAWGASAAIAQAAGTGRILRRLAASSFHPAPRVQSAIWSWQPAGDPLAPGLASFIRTVFSWRRKVLPGALGDAGWPRPAAVAACRTAGLDPTRRIEQLAVADLRALHAALAAAASPQS
jgi:16S rRNA (adenine1518-N6/adenine1519-N6)-dimethyltransferase